MDDANNIIQLKTEKWVEAFNESGLEVRVSSEGRAKMFINDPSGHVTLTIEQVIDLAIVMTCFGSVK